MNPESQPPQNSRAIELARWLCVLTAAILCRFVAYYTAGILGMLISSPFSAAELPALIYWIRFALYYLPRPAAFVIGGAITAPRHRLLTSIALAAISTVLSLMVHVLSQKNVGPTNFLHFSAESAAAVCGVLFIAIGRNLKSPCNSRPLSNTKNGPSIY